MHIHHNPMTPEPAGVHSAAAEKMAAAQRASETRRKLMKSASQIEGEGDGSLDAGQIVMISKWSEEPEGRQQRQQPRPQQEALSADEQRSGKPISVWA
jgi:hypothetical protein